MRKQTVEAGEATGALSSFKGAQTQWRELSQGEVEVNQIAGESTKKLSAERLTH